MITNKCLNKIHLNIIASKYRMTISSTKKINGNAGEPHTEGKNCDKRKHY